MNKDYLRSARQEAAIYDSMVTPKVAIDTYLNEMETPLVAPGTYKPESYDAIDWAKDAFTDWSVKRNQVNSDTNRGKAIMLNEDLDTFELAETYLSALLNKPMVEEALNRASSDGKPTSEIASELRQINDIINDPNILKAYEKVAKREVSSLTKDDIDFNLSKRPVEQQLSQVSKYKEDVLNKLSEAITAAEEYGASAKYWEDKHKISDYYNAKSLKEGFNFTDIDTYLYKAPGLLGSSASSMLSQAAAMAGGIIASTAAVTAGAAITAGTGGAATPLAVALVGATGSAAASMYSRSEESYAEVYQAYKDKIRRKSEEDGSYKLVIANAKKQLTGLGIDPSIKSDDEILDLVITNKLKSGSTQFDKTKISAVEGLESLYTDNMALSGVDIAQTALAVMPYGAIARKVTGLKTLVDKAGKLTGAIGKATNVSGAIGERIGQVATFGVENAAKALARKTTAKGIAEIGGKIVVTSAMEGMEEGTQYIKSQEYINDNFDSNPNIVKSFVKNLGTQARSLYAAVTPFDSVYSTDAEFMENFKGGALLGGLMTGATIGAQEVVSKVSTGKTGIGKQLDADKFVGALYTERVAEMDLFNKNLAYAQAVRNSSKLNIDASFDELAKMNIEGIDPTEIAKEKERANRVMALAESATNKRVAAANGIDPRTKDYDILVALQESARNRYKEATTATNRASGEVNSTLAKIDWSTIELPENVDQLQYLTAAISQIRQLTLESLIKDYQSAAEGLSKLESNTGTRTSKTDVMGVVDALQNILSGQQDTHKIVTSGLDMSNVGIPGVDTELLAAIEKLIYSEVDAAMLKEEIRVLNGAYARGKSDVTLAKKAVEKYKDAAKRETVQEQALQDDVRGVVEEPTQVEINPVPVTAEPLVVTPTTEPEVAPVNITHGIPPNPQDFTYNVARKKIIEEEPTDIVLTRSKALLDVEAQSINDAVKVAESALKHVYEDNIKPIPGIRPLGKGYEEFKAANEVDQYSSDENEDINFWADMYETKSKLQESIVNRDKDLMDEYSREVYKLIEDRNAKREAATVEAINARKAEKAAAEKQAAELVKPIETAEQIAPTDVVTAPVIQEEETPVETEEQLPEDLVYNRSVDPFSHQLNYWVNRKTNEPFLGYEKGFESSEDFAKVSTAPDFLDKSDVEFVVKPYTDKTGISSPAIYAEFTYNGKRYVAAIADPTSMRNYVSRGRSFELTNTVIDNLNLLRTKIMFLYHQSKPGTRIVPTLLERTDGVIVNLKNEDESPKNINLTETGLVAKDPFLITPESTQIGISTGTRGNELIRFAGNIVNGKGTRLGLAYIMHNNKPIQLNTRKFKQDPQVADLIVQLLTADNIDNVKLPNGQLTYFKAKDLIQLLVNFGPLTSVRNNDPRLTPAAATEMKKKQFFIDENKLFLGDKIYEVSDLLTNNKVKEEVTSYISNNFHWNVDESGLNEWYLSNESTPFGSIKTWLRAHPEELKLTIIPGVLEFDRKDVGLDGNPKGLSVMGWYIRQGVLQSDFGGYRDANIYVADVTTEKADTKQEIEKEIKELAELQQADTNEITDYAERIFSAKPKPTVKPVSMFEDSPEYAKLMQQFAQEDLAEADRLRWEEEHWHDPLFTTTIDKANASINTEAAKRWLEHTLGLTDEVRIVDNVLDILKSGQVVVGRAKLDSIELSKLAPEGVQYHEAWHRVSNLLISERNRRLLYDAYNRQNKSRLSDTEIDELMADEFMQFQLYAEPRINYQTTNWFKKIANFIRTWAKVSNFKLARLYYNINSGKYANAQVNEKNVERFKKLYLNIGPAFTMRGVELKSIPNVREFNNVIDNLTQMFFLVNRISDYNQIGKLDARKGQGIERLKLMFSVLQQLNPDNDVLAETLNRFNDVFAPALILRLTSYNTSIFEKLEQDSAEKIDAGDSDGVNIGEHTIASYEISARDNAPAEVKFFFLSIDDTMYDGDGKVIYTVNPTTGMRLFVDPRKAWNTVLIDLHDITNLNDLFRKTLKLAETNLFYKSVAYKLRTLDMQLRSDDPKVSADAETMLTKLENTIRAHKHAFITGKITRNDSGLIEVNIKDNTIDTKSIQYPKIWSASLFYNINKSGVFQLNLDGSVTITKNGKEIFLKFTANFTMLKRAFTQGKGVLKLPSGEFDIHQDDVQDKVKELLVDMLNSVGIGVDISTLNEMLTSGLYGDLYKLTSYQLLNNLVLNTNAYGGLQSISTVLDGILDQVKLQRSDIITTINSFGKNHEEIKTRPIDIWNNKGWVKLAAQYYAQAHVNADELRSLGADGNSLYAIAQNNFASDQVARLNKDTDYVSKLRSVVFNKHSLILNQLGADNTVLRLETFVNFKDDTAFDTGRDYFLITDREDYIAKMAMIFSDRILFPTVADKKTYHVINGAKLFHERISFTSVNGKQQATYGMRTMQQFIDYFNDEIAAIELCMQLIDDTVDEQGHHNPNWVAPNCRVKNYHTGNKEHGPNGVHFRLITGIYYTQGGKEVFLNFNDPNKTPQLNLQMAKNWLGNPQLSAEVKASLISSTLSKTIAKEVLKAKDLGLITANQDNDIYSMLNLLLDLKELNLRKAEYLKSGNPVIAANAEGYAIYDMLADYTMNSIISIVEVEKLFSGDPAYYKYKWGKNGIVDMSVDKIKRLGALTSTGLNNRLDFGSRFVRPTYNTAELNDYEIASKLYDQLEESFINGSIYDFVRVYHGDSAIYAGDGSYKSIDELKATEEYADAIAAATLQARKEVSGYKSGINVADAAVYVSPNMYRDMMRMIGQWSLDVEEAFNILTDPASSRLWESDPVLYRKVLKVSLKPLKYMAFGQRLSEIPGLGIPYFNKMALFPLFESVATGDMKPLYDRMTNPDNPLDMVMFNSAVKAGSVGAMDYYNGDQIADLNNLVVYTQGFENLRQQLNTDPHSHEEQMAGTQMLKVGLSNIHMNDLYGNTDKITGQQLKTEVFKTMNALSDIGAAKLKSKLFLENGEVDRKALYKSLRDEAAGSDANDNIVSGLVTDEYGRPVVPLAACSDNSFVESSFISTINKKTIDIDLPGGSFILRSTFGLEATAQSVISDGMLNNGKRLTLLNDDGSMDSIVSINLFKHIIPNYKRMTFTEARAWLIEHNIIGENAAATAIGYRIPTQAIASISALRFTDVLPEIMGDTIVLPEEFTKLTGSDFDVDKLFVARYQFKDGVKVTMDDSIENYAELNVNALKNNLIDMYMKVLLTKEHGNELKISIDNATENVKAILKDIESNRKTKTVEPFDVYAPSYQEERKQEYTGGKAGIGPMALNNAHHILTQLINPKFISDDLTNKLGLIDTNKIYDDPTMFTKKGGRILDWLSAMINGFVDIAKDPYIIRLNVNPWTYNMVTYLLRMGKGQQTFYFMGQPILKEMAEEVAKTKGKYGVDQTKTASQLEKEAVAKVLREYDPNGSIMKKYNKLTLAEAATELADLFTTYAAEDGSETSVTRELILQGREGFHNYNELLVRMYFAFKTLSNYANDMADLVKYSKIDTKKMGKSFVEQRGFSNGMKELASNSHFAFGEVQRFYDETFLTTKAKNSIDLGASVFQGELYRTSVGFTTYLDSILDELSRKSTAGNKILNALTKSMEAQIKSEFFNRKLQERGITTKEMLYGPRSIAKRLLAFKQLIYQRKYPDLLTSDGNIGNDFLEYIISNINSSDDATTPDFIDTAALFSEDVIQADNLINYWRDLLEHDKPEIKRLAEDLVLYAFITSGDNNNANSFFNYVPNSWRIDSGYVNFTNTKLEALQQEGGLSNMSKTDFYLNNWHDNLIVKPYVEVVPVLSQAMELDDRGRPVERMTSFYTFNKPSTQHGRPLPVLILGKRADRSAIADDIRPIGYKQVFQEGKLKVVPVFPPYIKIKFGKQNTPQNNVMYELVGFKEEGQDGKLNIFPVYSIIEKRGMKYKGHVVVEYGRSDRLPFNQLDVAYDGKSAIDTGTILADIFQQSSMSDNYKNVLFELFAYVQPIADLYRSDAATKASDQVKSEQAEVSSETAEDGGLDFGDVYENENQDETNDTSEFNNEDEFPSDIKNKCKGK